jgi:isopentenyldiphosphate isomerase
MSESEFIDVYSDDGRPTGSVERSRAHRDGLWHRALHCWVVTGDGALLVQRRSAGVRHWQGLLDISAAGHLVAGESWTDALREVEEELGLMLTRADVVDTGERRDVLRLPGMVDRELARTVFARCEQPLEDYRPGPEVASVIAFDLAGAAAVFGGERSSIRCPAVRVAGNPAFDEVSAADFVPRPAGYYLAVVDRARRVLAGARALEPIPDTGA